MLVDVRYPYLLWNRLSAKPEIILYFAVQTPHFMLVPCLVVDNYTSIPTVGGTWLSSSLLLQLSVSVAVVSLVDTTRKIIIVLLCFLVIRNIALSEMEFCETGCMDPLSEEKAQIKRITGNKAEVLYEPVGVYV